MNPSHLQSFRCLSLLVLFTSPLALTAQPKAYLYDESKVAPYELPDPLLCLDGTKVTDAKTWLNKRRPEVLRLFEDEVYGRSPGKPKAMRFEVVEKGVDALAGKATRKQVLIHLGKGDKALAVNLLLYLPKKAKGPAPGFLTVNFMGNHTVHADPSIQVLPCRSFHADPPMQILPCRSLHPANQNLRDPGFPQEPN